MTDPTTTPPRSLDDRLDSTAEGWRPEPGDKLIGVVVDVDSRDGGYGLYPVVTIETDDGDEIAVHAFHTVLKREFAKRPPVIGERLGIKYAGKVTSGDTTYESYRIAWDKVTAPPDWTKIGEAAEAEAAAAGIDDEPRQNTGGPLDDGIPFD